MLAGSVLADSDYQLTRQHQIFWNNCSNQAFLFVGRRLYYLQPVKDGSLVSTLILDGFDFRKKGIKTHFWDRDTDRLFLGSQFSGLYVISKKQFRTVIDPSGKLSDNVHYGQVLVNNKEIATAGGVVFSLDSGSMGAVARKMNLIAKSVDWDRYGILKDRRGTICWTSGSTFRAPTA